jgi:hypothetical protein
MVMESPFIESASLQTKIQFGQDLVSQRRFFIDKGRTWNNYLIKRYGSRHVHICQDCIFLAENQDQITIEMANKGFAFTLSKLREEKGDYEMTITESQTKPFEPDMPQVKKLILWHNALPVGEQFGAKRAAKLCKADKSMVYKYAQFAIERDALKQARVGTRSQPGLYEKLMNLPDDAYEHYKEEHQRKKVKKEKSSPPKPPVYTEAKRKGLIDCVIDADQDSLLVDRASLERLVEDYNQIIRSLAKENEMLKRKFVSADMLSSLVPEDVRKIMEHKR